MSIKRALVRNLPTILTIAGTVGVVTGGVLACKATLKCDQVISENVTRVEAVRETGYTSEKLYRKDLAIAYGKNVVGWAKLYGPAIMVGGFSLGCILYGHNMLRVRNLAVVGAYKALTTDFQAYRERIADTFGSEEELKARYDIADVEVSDLDTGEKKTFHMFPEPDPEIEGNEFAKFFCESSRYWEDDPERNLEFLLDVQRKMQARLEKNGYLLLNDVYYALDIPRTYAGKLHGWYVGYEPDIIDFGIYDGHREGSKRFVNGLEPVILLDFNCKYIEHLL